MPVSEWTIVNEDNGCLASILYRHRDYWIVANEMFKCWEIVINILSDFKLPVYSPLFSCISIPLLNAQRELGDNWTPA